MIRNTSIESYNKIKSLGLLSRNRWRVYEILFHRGPMIGASVSSIYRTMYGIRSASETIRNRLTELRNYGVIQEVGKAYDVHTGMLVILWDVTPNLPNKIKPKEKIPCVSCDGLGYFELK